MPDVTNDERGRRIFQIHKERAVEMALEKIRHNPGSEIGAFSAEDIRTLNYILGEAWVSVGRQIWELSAKSSKDQSDIYERGYQDGYPSGFIYRTIYPLL